MNATQLSNVLAEHHNQVQQGLDRKEPDTNVFPLRESARNLSSPRELIGRSSSMQAVREHTELFAARTEPVLIIGETGCGKEIVAENIHRAGPQSNGPFVAVNCAALPDSLAEAELFGYVRGAFTGAEKDHEGALDSAAQGTLFLDELSSLPPRIQGILLRVLETGDYRPVGGTASKQLTARIVSATNEGLEEAVAQNRFRADLLFRLQRLTISIPPLREHSEDLGELCQHLLSRLKLSVPPEIGDDLLQAYKEYTWPGNVRELRNELENLIVLHGDEAVLRRHHSQLVRRAGDSAILRVQSAPSPAAVLTPPSAALEPKMAPPGQVLSAAAPVAHGASERIDTESNRGVEEPLAAKQAPKLRGLPPSGGRKVAMRRQQMLDLMFEHGSVTRSQLIAVIGCAPNTATADLKALEDDGYIRRIVKGGNLKNSYFVLNDG